MSDSYDDFSKQLAEVRSATQRLIEAVLLDMWPHHGVIVDFGLDSQQHYEALYYPIREGEIMPRELDAALGHGEKLTALVQAAASNPHKDVAFHTSWDVILGRKPFAHADPTAAVPGDQLKEQPQEPGKGQPQTYSIDELRAKGRELRQQQESAQQQRNDRENDR